jgi:hypothetical protein
MLQRISTPVPYRSLFSTSRHSVRRSVNALPFGVYIYVVLTSSICTVDTLIVGFNSFVNSHLPTTVGQLTNLGMYEMTENRGPNAVLSYQLALRYTESLIMPSMALDGTIPTEIGKLTKLCKCERDLQLILCRPCRDSQFLVPAILMLHANQLTGTIPAALGNLALAEKMLLYLNQLQGSMPQEICTLTETGVLKELVVSCGLSPGPDCDCCMDCTEI